VRVHAEEIKQSVMLAKVYRVAFSSTPASKLAGDPGWGKSHLTAWVPPYTNSDFAIAERADPPMAMGAGGSRGSKRKVTA